MYESKPQPADFPLKQADGVLYVVATPIGNLQDITFRAVEVLKQADVIACEDTRVTRVLCQHYGIDAPLIPYHEHNSDEAMPALLRHLGEGKQVALVSDAGTPLISDPGYRLVRDVAAAGFRVVPIPGASSMVCAASAAGLPTERIYYAGFLPHKAQARQQVMQELAGLQATLVLFESNHRLIASLQDAITVFGEGRQAVIAREMTKHFEEFTRGSLADILAHYQQKPQVKGEIVWLIAPATQEVRQLASLIPLVQALVPYYPVKQVAVLLADSLNVSRNDVYALALEEKAKLA